MPTEQSGPNARLNCLNYNDLNGQPLEKAVIVNIFGGSRNMICFYILSILLYSRKRRGGKDGLEFINNIHGRVVVLDGSSRNVEGEETTDRAPRDCPWIVINL